MTRTPAIKQAWSIVRFFPSHELLRPSSRQHNIRKWAYIMTLVARIKLNPSAAQCQIWHLDYPKQQLLTRWWLPHLLSVLALWVPFPAFCDSIAFPITASALSVFFGIEVSLQSSDGFLFSSGLILDPELCLGSIWSPSEIHFQLLGMFKRRSSWLGGLWPSDWAFWMLSKNDRDTASKEYAD